MNINIIQIKGSMSPVQNCKVQQNSINMTLKYPHYRFNAPSTKIQALVISISFHFTNINTSTSTNPFGWLQEQKNCTQLLLRVQIPLSLYSVLICCLIDVIEFDDHVNYLNSHTHETRSFHSIILCLLTSLYLHIIMHDQLNIELCLEMLMTWKTIPVN